MRGIQRTYVMGDNLVHALRGVDLEIDKGASIAIMGTSGSGKSTMMNIMGCLDQPYEGQYLLNGKDVSRLSRAQLAEVRGRMIGFVFQSFNLLSRTTALENVELPLLYQGVAARERHNRAMEALERVGLAKRFRLVGAPLVTRTAESPRPMPHTVRLPYISFNVAKIDAVTVQSLVAGLVTIGPMMIRCVSARIWL